MTTVLQGIDGQSGKNGELSKLEEEFKENCWTVYTKYKSTTLVHAFDEFRNSKQKFKDKMLLEAKSNTVFLESDLSVLKSKAQTIFGKNPVTESIIQPIDLLVEKVIAHESNSILKKRVFGKEDVDIAAMIKKLGNSDWVKAGRSFYEVNDKICPFCQQSTTNVFTQSLTEYFDETYL